MWLSLVGSTQVAQILTIYKETQIGPKVTRPLSTDTAIRTSIQNILKVTFSSQDRGAPIVSTLLQLDLDLVLPNEEEALWSYIDQCQDYHLLAKCLQAYVDIRSLPSFFTCLLKLQKVSTSLITKSFSNSLANEVSRLTEAVQDGIMQIVVQSVSLLKEPLLVALIGGLHPGSSVLPRYLAMLSITDLDGRLKRVIALKCRAGSSKLIKSIANTATTKETNSAECETWLRLKEVQSTSTIQDDDEKNDSIWIDLLLSTISQNIGFFVAVVRRWLPAVVPLMSSSQRLSFVRVVLSKIDDERITEIMFQESVLLEIPELHGVLQDEILNTLTSDTTPLYKIPTDFFHKAVKRQIVTSLASQPSLNELQCQMLLKYAYTGIYPMFAEAGDYLKFANSSLASNTTLPISMASTQEQLRRKYIKTLSQTQCKDIIEDKSCNALLQLEVVEECLTSNDLLDAAKKLSLAIRNSIFKDNYSSTDLHTQAIVLLRLLKTFRKLDIETSFLAESQEDRPVAQWLSLIKLKPDAQMSHTYLELAAWQVASVEDALNVIQGALQHATIETSFLDEMFQGFSYCLSVEMLQSLLAERTLESIPKHRAHLLLEVVQNKSRTDVLSSPWIRQQFKKTCHDLIRCQGDDELLTALNILQTLLETHARALDITSIDDLCECIQQCLQTDSTSSMLTQTYGLHRLLRATFQHHAYRLKDRYHIIILLFQRLLTVCLRKPTEMAKEETESFVRLFETFLVSSRALSINPEQFNRAVAKHVPWLLIEYIDGVTSSDFSDKISVQTKKTVEEGLVYECMSLCGQHEREMVATSLDSAGRGMFKRLFEDWSKFGRWTER
ncbi:protein of unknown function [Taphrina deformans PYCC 5710]|uniref:Nucleolar 27S pre-rRNA processing Urb2/Npa2 C-terminal domain-containing protein n=1 Tax=Taphrina deformans (strain PYCC 5710 / ATCC 11124 / CBS 356.35 / IMI 108563 / JCM 9778 / NBRC 8474) TaxID=1097556 RepID=R4XDA7_TAPDE|nr:protein of unknown function [Taphrina deformans PYCC 5710]|eukprot:CCG83815.1 protein of unknown function [Taphrina deformans PYCC 5710]